MSFNLSQRLLTKSRVLASSATQWRDFVSSLFIQPEVRVSVPRVKKLKLPHNVQAGAKLCSACGKKVRNPAAICLGEKNPLPNTEPTP